MAFWRRLLEGTSWQTLLSYVSPAFFQIVSPRDVSRSAYRLVRNWFDEEAFQEVVLLSSSSIEALNCGLSVVATTRRRSHRPFQSELPQAHPSGQACRTGDKALILFFHQIYTDGPVLLDLRRSHFFCESLPPHGRLRYEAPPLYCTWTPAFRAALRDLYAAFYGSASRETYLAALSALGLAPVADIFERTFGGPHKRAARFLLSDFRTTFHDIFMRCLQARTMLDRDFLTLGIAIATLYDHLEVDGGSYDVTQCYLRALPQTQH